LRANNGLARDREISVKKLGLFNLKLFTEIRWNGRHAPWNFPNQQTTMPPSKRSLPWQRSGYEQQLPAYRRSASWSRGRNKQARRQARPAARPPASTPASGPRAPSPDYFGSDDDDDLEWLDPPAPQATPPSSSGATQVANRPIAQPTPRLTPQSSQPLSGRTPQSSSRPGAFTVPPSVIQTPPATQQRSQPYNRGGMPSSSQGTPTSSYRPSQIVRPNTQSVTPAINIPAPQINRMSWQSSQSSQPSSQSNPIVIDSDDEDISSTPYQPENDFIPIGYVSKNLVAELVNVLAPRLWVYSIIEGLRQWMRISSWYANHAISTTETPFA
jgi:hypothetical protein